MDERTKNKKLIDEINSDHEVTQLHFIGWTMTVVVGSGILVVGAMWWLYSKLIYV